MAKRGRPEQYGKGFIRAFKNVVRKHGLLRGQVILNEQGINLFGKHIPISISLPTLSKYVKRHGVGGPKVALKQGRPRKAA
jgi:hypothetical protein